MPKMTPDQILAALDAMPEDLPNSNPIENVKGLFSRHVLGEIDIDELRECVLMEVQDLLNGQAW